MTLLHTDTATARRPGTHATGAWRSRGVLVGLLLVLPATLLGFWKSYFAILGALPASTTAVVHVHGALMFLWLVLLPAQAWLYRTRRLRAHRWVGRSSFVLVPLIVAFGLATLHHEFTRKPDELETVARLDSLAVGMMVAFTLTWALGMRYRRNPELHVRYMVSTAFALGTAIVWRIFVFWVPALADPSAAAAANGVVLLLGLLALIAADWRRGMRRSPYWVVTIVVAAMHVGYWTVAKSGAWIGLCRWFAGLPAPG